MPIKRTRKEKRETRGRYGEGSLFLRPNKPGGMFWFTIPNPAGGPKIQGSCETRNRDEALAFKDNKRAELKKLAAGGSARAAMTPEERKAERRASITIGQLFDSYVSTLGGRTAYVTGKTVDKHLREYVHPEANTLRRDQLERLAIELATTPEALRMPLGQRRALSLTTKELRAYRSAKLAEGQSDCSIDHHMAYLGRSFQVGFENGILKRDDAPFFPKVFPDNERTGWLPPDGYPVLLNAMRPSMKIVFVFLYHYGIRIGELLQYDWAFVDWTQGLIRVPREICKNKQGREVPILDGDVKDFLLAQKKIQEECFPLCRSIFFWHNEANREGFQHGPSVAGSTIKQGTLRPHWDRIVAGNGYPGIMMHDMRRTATVVLVNQFKFSPQDAALITGHLSIRMLLRYLRKSTDKLQDLARRMEAGIRDAKVKARAAAA